MINFWYLLTGATYGYIEAYIMEHGFSTGPMDFHGFKKAYHGALLLLAVAIGIGMNCLEQIFLWVLVEDLMFWAADKWGPKSWGFTYKYKLTKDSWIAKMMGSLKYKNVTIPVVYIVLLVVGLLSMKYL